MPPSSASTRLLLKSNAMLRLSACGELFDAAPELTIAAQELVIGLTAGLTVHRKRRPPNWVAPSESGVPFAVLPPRYTVVLLRGSATIETLGTPWPWAPVFRPWNTSPTPVQFGGVSVAVFGPSQVPGFAIWVQCTPRSCVQNRADWKALNAPRELMIAA